MNVPLLFFFSQKLGIVNILQVVQSHQTTGISKRVWYCCINHKVILLLHSKKFSHQSNWVFTCPGQLYLQENQCGRAKAIPTQTHTQHKCSYWNTGPHSVTLPHSQPLHRKYLRDNEYCHLKKKLFIPFHLSPLPSPTPQLSLSSYFLENSITAFLLWPSTCVWISTPAPGSKHSP